MPWRWLLPLAMMALAGCASYQKSGRVEQLDNTARAYAKALRWGDYERAASIAGIEADKVAMEMLQRVRVIAYEEGGPVASPEADEARQAVRIDYTLESTMKVRRIVDEQQWRYDAGKERWILTTGFPRFFAGK